MKVYTVFDLRSLCLAALVGFWSAGSLASPLLALRTGNVHMEIVLMGEAP